MKKKILIGSLVLGLSAAGAFWALGGVSLLDSLGLRGQERLVHQRMDSYWQARVKGDDDTMGEYVHPLRKEVLQPGMLVTEAYEINDLEVNGDEATASVRITNRLSHPLLSSRSREVVLNSRWVRYEGKWYREPKPVGVAEAIEKYRGRWTPPAPDATSEDVE